jgi:hypothetical protein
MLDARKLSPQLDGWSRCAMICESTVYHFFVDDSISKTNTSNTDKSSLSGMDEDIKTEKSGEGVVAATAGFSNSTENASGETQSPATQVDTSALVTRVGGEASDKKSKCSPVLADLQFR